MHHDRGWCKEKGLSILKVILEHANPNKYSFNGETPLVRAYYYYPLSDTRPTIKELLRSRAIVIKPSKNSLSPLRAVCSLQYSSADMIDVL